MRARMALAKAGVTVELREVVLRDKPLALIEASAKATVPVLALPDGTVIDESRDILLWAFGRSDPDNWLSGIRTELAEMVVQNDGEFKKNLDRYKYSNRQSESTRDAYRDAGAKWLAVLDDRLRASAQLAGDTPTALDIAILPFIRQFANTDLKWFETSPYRSLRRWLDFWVNSELFLSIMHKYPQWKPGDPITPSTILK